MNDYPTEEGFYFVKMRDGEITVCEMKWATCYKPPQRHYDVIASDEIWKDKDFGKDSFIRKIEP